MSQNKLQAWIVETKTKSQIAEYNIYIHICTMFINKQRLILLFELETNKN